jgi:hypothetical protein
MDGMALLCNLHADGPETLRSLRAEGCSSLQELDGFGVDRLVAVLGLTPAAARRFLREGRLLLERLNGQGEGEEEGRPTFAQPLALAAAPAGALPVGEQALLRRVLERWSELDAGPASRSAPRPAEPEPEAEAEEPGERLAPGRLELLDAGLCAALARAGITSLEALASLRPDRIAELCGIPFTRARRLQFSARRALEADLLPARAPVPRRLLAAEKISLAFPDLPREAAPAPEPAPRAAFPVQEGPGGPFA